MTNKTYPTGGFTHSMGCEALLQRSYIANKIDIKKAIVSILENSGSFNIPYVQDSYDNCEDLDHLCQLDDLYHVSLNNQVASRVSRQQGKSMLFTSEETFKCTNFSKFQLLIDNGNINGHHAIVFGFICAVLKISKSHTLQMYLFTVLRTVITSLVRLGCIGPIEAQTLQYHMQKMIPDIIQRNIDKNVEDASIIFPLIDVFQNSHDTLFRKMFYS
ncbi:uncharacterized protein [Centruroides vittatus]|uniref:uncharacterized protein isoform X2 n=1 Tax=Centruroides vittatus TaxID=120091 RepID=UPI00350FF342